MTVQFEITFDDIIAAGRWEQFCRRFNVAPCCIEMEWSKGDDWIPMDLKDLESIGMVRDGFLIGDEK